MRVQGRYVGDRVSANECLVTAIHHMTQLENAMVRLHKDTAGNANRLNDHVREVMKYLRNAEKLLEQRGEA